MLDEKVYRFFFLQFQILNRTEAAGEAIHQPLVIFIFWLVNTNHWTRGR